MSSPIFATRVFNTFLSNVSAWFFLAAPIQMIQINSNYFLKAFPTCQMHLSMISNITCCLPSGIPNFPASPYLPCLVSKFVPYVPAVSTRELRAPCEHAKAKVMASRQSKICSMYVYDMSSFSYHHGNLSNLSFKVI